MPIWDLTHPLHEGMPAFPGDPPFERQVLKRLAAGDPFELSRLGLSAHAGTHVDPPAHFVAGGATVDRLTIDALLGEAVVLDLTGVASVVRPEDLERAALPAHARIVLLRTGSSPGAPRWTTLSPEAATWLAEGAVRTVGIDGPSLDPGDEVAAHRALAERGIVAVVNLRLDGVAEGRYGFACLPILIEGGDGAPARALLWTPGSFPGPAF
jgi:arylformamidase